jgi:hypothetical protein
MSNQTSIVETLDDSNPEAIDWTALPKDQLTAYKTEITAELERRQHDADLADAEQTELVNGQFVKWATLSQHANKKAVKPWILKVTDTHDKFGVDGNWLNKQTIDGNVHMDITPLEAGDIIRVSGASHNNKKHRYYRVHTITEDTLYYGPNRGLKEADVIEEVG